MTPNRRTNSKFFPDTSPTPAPTSSSSQDTSEDVGVIEAYLPVPTAAYSVVPFEHTIGTHANASAHLLAE